MRDILCYFFLRTTFFALKVHVFVDIIEDYYLCIYLQIFLFIEKEKGFSWLASYFPLNFYIKIIMLYYECYKSLRLQIPYLLDSVQSQFEIDNLEKNCGNYFVEMKRQGRNTCF